MKTMIATINNDVLGHESHFEQLYESAFPKVALFVSKMNGSFDEAKDIFHDALVIFIEQAGATKFVSEEAYILGIAKHLWIRKFNLDKRRVLFNSFEQHLNIPVEEPVDVNANRLLRVLETAGKKCMELLHAVYFDNAPVKQITRRLRYRNEHATSVQKYKCLQKVRDIVKHKSMSYEQFIG